MFDSWLALQKELITKTFATEFTHLPWRAVPGEKAREKLKTLCALYG